jgi:mono/diheme cytochrome c family protein
MKFPKIYAGLAMACIALSMGSAVAGESADPSVSSPVTAERAMQVYSHTCGYCHKADGVGPVLWGRNLNADFIEKMVRLGPGGMPAFRPTEITPAELKEIAALISTQSAPPSAP